MTSVGNNPITAILSEILVSNLEYVQMNDLLGFMAKTKISKIVDESLKDSAVIYKDKEMKNFYTSIGIKLASDKYKASDSEKSVNKKIASLFEARALYQEAIANPGTFFMDHYKEIQNVYNQIESRITKITEEQTLLLKKTKEDLQEAKEELQKAKTEKKS